MRKLQNTLYITTQGSYLHRERETLVVEQERKKVAQLPVHSLLSNIRRSSASFWRAAAFSVRFRASGRVAPNTLAILPGYGFLAPAMRVSASATASAP